MRNILNAILYISRTGAQWRYLPEKYPPRSTVFEYFSQWQKDGTWDWKHLKYLDWMDRKICYNSSFKIELTRGMSHDKSYSFFSTVY